MNHTDWFLHWWDWFVQLTWWQGLFVALAITPFGLWAVRLVMQGKLLNPFKYDWMSFNCDALLGVGVGASLVLATRMPEGTGFVEGSTWYYVLNYGSIVLWGGFGLHHHLWRERFDVPTWTRRLGATSVYHFGIYLFFAPFMTVLFVNTARAPWDTVEMWVLHFVPIVAVAAWVLAGGVYDANPKHRTVDGRPKHDFTSPEDGWRNIRLLLGWLKLQYSPPELQSVQVGERFDSELDSEPLPNKLESFPWWNWMLCPHPILIFVTGVVVSPGIMELNDVLFVHGHFVPLDAQWLSALFDVALWGAIAIMVAMLRRMSFHSFPGWLTSLPAHIIFLLIPIVVGGLHVWDEWDDIPMSARTGINYLYHNIVLFPFLGYLLVMLLVSTIRMLLRNREAYTAWWYWLGTAFSLAFIGAWLWAGDFDKHHQYAPGGIHKAAFANPANPWNGIIPRGFAKLNELVQWGFGPVTEYMTPVIDWGMKQFT